MVLVRLVSGEGVGRITREEAVDAHLVEVLERRRLANDADVGRDAQVDHVRDAQSLAQRVFIRGISDASRAEQVLHQ